MFFVCVCEKLRNLRWSLTFLFLISFILFSLVFCHSPLKIDGISSVLRVLQSVCLFHESLSLPGNNCGFAALPFSGVSCQVCTLCFDLNLSFWLLLVAACLQPQRKSLVQDPMVTHSSSSFIHNISLLTLMLNRLNLFETWRCSDGKVPCAA